MRHGPLAQGAHTLDGETGTTHRRNSPNQASWCESAAWSRRQNLTAGRSSCGCFTSCIWELHRAAGKSLTLALHSPVDPPQLASRSCSGPRLLTRGTCPAGKPAPTTGPRGTCTHPPVALFPSCLWGESFLLSIEPPGQVHLLCLRRRLSLR